MMVHDNDAPPLVVVGFSVLVVKLGKNQVNSTSVLRDK